MKLLNLKFLPFLLSFISGILTSHYILIPLHYWLLLFLVTICALALLKKKADKRFLQKTDFALLSFLSFFLLGALVLCLNSSHRFKSHYAQHNGFINSKYWVLTINNPLKPTANYNRYVASLIQMDTITVTGTILVNVKKDSLKELDNGSLIAIKANLIPIRKSPNPGQFDFAGYFKKKQIFHQLYPDDDNLKIIGEKRSLKSFSERIRTKLRKKLEKTAFIDDELAIINALLLGYRFDLSNEINEAFASAGVIHILAISGLHIGILLILLNFIFKPLDKIKNGRIYKSFIIILLLWCFALLTGLSPSVVRAVTMFSFFAYAMNRKKVTNTVQVMLISMFFVLLFNPMFIFDVGFQLSYTAVFSILWIQPTAAKLYTPKNKIINYLWTLLTVTFAAQLGLLPLSLYYFHQFPGLFFISNLVILPFLGLLLGFGMLIIILSAFNYIPDVLVNIYGMALELLQKFVFWIARQEAFIFQNIFFDIKMLIASYVCIICLILLFKEYSKKKLFATTLALVVLWGVVILNNHLNSQKDSLIIFQQNRETLMARHKGNTLTVYTNSVIKPENSFLIKNYRIQYPIETIKKEKLPDSLIFGENKVIILDTLTKPIPLNSNLLLRNSPRINLDRIILKYQPRMIIADGSNYRSFKKRWKASCQKQKLPYHDTYEQGAFIINY